MIFVSPQTRLCACGNPMRQSVLWEIVDEHTIGWVVFRCESCGTIEHDFGELKRWNE